MKENEDIWNVSTVNKPTFTNAVVEVNQESTKAISFVENINIALTIENAKKYIGSNTWYESNRYFDFEVRETEDTNDCVSVEN